MAENLLMWWPHLTEEERRTITFALRNHPPSSKYLISDWLTAADDPGQALLSREVAIVALRHINKVYGTTAALDLAHKLEGEPPASRRNNMADPLEAAYSLVGRFQYHFARIEQKIDQAVIKLLDLDDKAAPIVTASVDFAKKLNLLWGVAYKQASNDQGREFVDKTCKAVFAVNTNRQLVIHSSFEPAPTGGVQFRRTVAKDGRVRVDNQVWNDQTFSEHCSKMSALETELDKLIEPIKPAELPPFDWYVPWQSTYQRSSSAGTPLAALVAANSAATVDKPS